jgi:hypothetical protein
MCAVVSYPGFTMVCDGENIYVLLCFGWDLIPQPMLIWSILIIFTVQVALPLVTGQSGSFSLYIACFNLIKEWRRSNEDFRRLSVGKIFHVVIFFLFTYFWFVFVPIYCNIKKLCKDNVIFVLNQ